MLERATLTASRSPLAQSKGYYVPEMLKMSAIAEVPSRLDSEYIILAAVLTLIGVSGVVLFNGPKTPAGDSCFCIIPSPEASAMQGTAGILLIFGVMFIPIGILKGGLPGRRVGPPPPQTVGSGRVFTPVWLNSGGQLAFGVALAVIGIDLLLAPGYLVFHNTVMVAGGGVLGLLGGLLAVRGGRTRSSKQ